MLKYVLFILVASLSSCGNNLDNPRELIIEDLPFHVAEDAKSYSDLILRAIRTNREKPVIQEFALGKINVDESKMNEMINVYSSGIGGRSDWEYFDVYEFNESKDQSNGFDYVWMDPKGRLGIQIYVLPELKAGVWILKKLEFRSRLEAMESWAFPGGEIDSYKKLDFDW